uniref:Uncharacterized protein n=1 Tax=Zooxanthella nutricula TaxID=1333877 RepID=A0A6U6N8I3_9DINO
MAGAQVEKTSTGRSSAGRAGANSSHEPMGMASAFVDGDELRLQTTPYSFEAAGPAGQRDAVLLELHLRGLSLDRLHSSIKSSVTEFLLALQNELRQSEGQRGQRLDAVSIFGRYRADAGKTQPGPADSEVVVGLRAATVQNRSIDQVIDNLHAHLTHLEPTCVLAERYGFALENVSIASGIAGSGRVPRSPVQEKSMGAMFLPIIISAAFTGLLIWVAAA